MCVCVFSSWWKPFRAKWNGLQIPYLHWNGVCVNIDPWVLTSHVSYIIFPSEIRSSLLFGNQDTAPWCGVTGEATRSADHGMRISRSRMRMMRCQEMSGKGRSVLTMSLVSPVHLAPLSFPCHRRLECRLLCNRKDNWYDSHNHSDTTQLENNDMMVKRHRRHPSSWHQDWSQSAARGTNSHVFVNSL